MMSKLTIFKLSLLSGLFVLCGCSVQTSVDNSPGRPTQYEDPGSAGLVRGVGVESQDIKSMCDRMMREILDAPQIAARAVPPLVIIDDQNFTNESTSRLNKRLITDQLRVELNRAAQGRMYFISRENIGMVEKERMLKQEGVVTTGTLPMTPATAGADFRLAGRIASLDAIDNTSGFQSRYHQITLELINLQTGIIAWSGRYEFQKAAQEGVEYR
jgi:PBP1b-binding outer membrane lipoprotein LpoB